MGAAIIIIFFIVLFFVGFIALSRSCVHRQINRQTQAVEERTNKIIKNADSGSSQNNNILVVTTPDIQGREIKKILGFVKGISGRATTEKEFGLTEQESYYNMISEARKLGANAIVNVRISTGTYAQQGSQWQVSQIIYTGTAAVIQ